MMTVALKKALVLHGQARVKSMGRPEEDRNKAWRAVEAVTHGGGEQGISTLET